MISLLFMLATVIGSPAHAAAPTVPAKPALAGMSQQLETDLAALLQQRADVAPADAPPLDLQIDLRVVDRWLIDKAAGASPDSDLQVCAYLRAANVFACASQLAAILPKTGSGLSAAQLDGMSKLHQMTFKLDELKSVQQMDEQCRNLAIFLFAAYGPLPPELRTVPPMRPQPMASPASREGPRQQPKTLAQLTAMAQKAAVSPPLQKQLAALSLAATAASGDSARQDEAATLFDMLSQVVELTDGLQTNTGVDAQSRTKVEGQLVEGLALYTDPRTRPGGRTRIDALSRYRDTLARVRRLRLPADLREKFAPVFVFAQQDPAQGARVLDMIETWEQLAAKFDAHKDPVFPSSNLRRMSQEAGNQFKTERDGFLNDAEGLGGGGALSSGPPELQKHLDQMQSALDAMETAAALPHAGEVLETFRPRPGGGLEKHVTTAVATMGMPSGAGRAEAADFLHGVVHLAQLATDTSTSSANLPANVARDWTAGKLTTFQSHCSTLVTAQASQAASGKPFDKDSLSRLEAARSLVDRLRDAVSAEDVISHAEVLARWVDSPAGVVDLRTVFGPYREATAAAFEAFSADDSGAAHDWPATRDRYAPLAAMLVRLSGYAGQCAALPGGAVGEMAKLATPMDHQPFALERYVSFALGIWTRYEQIPDLKAADTTADLLVAKLRKDSKSK